MARIPCSLIVGIGGGSASGKSTLTAALSAELTENDPKMSVTAITADTYFRADDPLAPKFLWSLKNEWVFDYNRLDSADYARLRSDIEVLAAADERPEIVIVEGVMILAVQEIHALLDLRFFVDLDADIRLARRLLRDTSSKSRRYSQPDEIISYYLESARRGHADFVEPSRIHADVTVRGDADVQRTAHLLAAIIRDRHRAKEDEDAAGED